MRWRGPLRECFVGLYLPGFLNLDELSKILFCYLVLLREFVELAQQYFVMLQRSGGDIRPAVKIRLELQELNVGKRLFVELSQRLEDGDKLLRPVRRDLRKAPLRPTLIHLCKGQLTGGNVVWVIVVLSQSDVGLLAAFEIPYSDIDLLPILPAVSNAGNPRSPPVPAELIHTSVPVRDFSFSISPSLAFTFLSHLPRRVKRQIQVYLFFSILARFFVLCK